MATVVAFHAHPDDEALLTGGTLALLADQGHRVVLVVATSGEAGLTGTDATPSELGARRSAELRRSAEALGCARVVELGYPDSGWNPDQSGRAGAGFATVPVDVASPAGAGFATVPVDVVAAALADILREEQADALTMYDANGGYGHPDHIQVHRVGLAAAAAARTPRVLQATLDRSRLRHAIRLLQLLRLVPPGTVTDRLSTWFAGPTEITHRIPVRRYADAKRAALACHASQATGGDGPRTTAILLALPKPLFRRVCGTEWFAELNARPGQPILADILLSAVAPRTVVAGPL
jgi:LmbE family N-acetylglucosaminyl deacetylase